MDKQFLIEVSDNGIGIDKEDVDRLVRGFIELILVIIARRNRAGLSIVKHIIELHNKL